MHTIKPVKDLKKKQLKKRVAIIDSAIKIFACKGFYSSSIAEIAHLADVAVGTVYLYFKNKDDLLIKTFESLLDDLMANIRQDIDHLENPREKVVAFFDRHIDYFVKNPDVAKFFLTEFRQASDFIAIHKNYKVFDGYLNYIKGLCQQAVDEGFYKDIDPLALTYMLFGTVDFVLTEWLMHDKGFSLEEMKNNVKAILRQGIEK